METGTAQEEVASAEDAGKRRTLSRGAVLTPSACQPDKGLGFRDLRTDARKGIHDFHGWPAHKFSLQVKVQTKL
jgi:hypothetical protein